MGRHWLFPRILLQIALSMLTALVGARIDIGAHDVGRQDWATSSRVVLWTRYLDDNIDEAPTLISVLLQLPTIDYHPQGTHPASIGLAHFGADGQVELI